MRTVLITGGAGFIGSNLVEYLSNKYSDYKLIVLDSLTYAGKLDSISEEVKNSPRFEFWHGSVCNSELVNAVVGQAGIVIHLAAESHVARSIFDNKIFFETDVLGTQAVANAVLNHYKTVERFIHVSTSEVYGTAVEIPMTEEHPLNPTTPYASAKAGADRLVYSYGVSHDIPAVILRPFNNYGPRQHLEKVIPRFITAALRGKPLTVHGDGTNARDWLYVEDNCKAIDRAMHVDLDRVRGQVINIGTGIETNVLDIGERIRQRCESRIQFVEERLGQVERHCSSTEKAEELLGWRAETPFDEGLERTIDWYAKHQDWWKEQIWMETVQIRTKTGEILYH